MIIRDTASRIVWMPNVGNDYIEILSLSEFHQVHMIMISPISGRILTSNWHRFPNYINRSLLLRWAIRKMGHTL